MLYKVGKKNYTKLDKKNGTLDELQILTWVIMLKSYEVSFDIWIWYDRFHVSILANSYIIHHLKI